MIIVVLGCESVLLKRNRINNHVSENEIEDLERKYQESLAHIHWLEQEVLRLKLLLEGDNSMCNSLPTVKPVDN